MSKSEKEMSECFDMNGFCYYFLEYMNIELPPLNQAIHTYTHKHMVISKQTKANNNNSTLVSECWKREYLFRITHIKHL